jgi:hypothetical protein
MTDRPKPDRPKRLLLQRVDDAPSFSSIARAIGDRRLEPTLQDLSECIIKREIKLKNARAPRSEVRRAITELRKKATEFETAINGVWKVVLELPIDFLPSLKAAREAMHSVVADSGKALSMISPKGGARKKPGLVSCAMIVIEAWASVHGSTPGHDNETAQEICADYWLASTGTPADGEYMWSRHIRTASKSQSKLRHFIRDRVQNRP